MFDAFITGLLLVFEWPAIGFLFLGVFIGIWLGAIPGLGGIIGLVLLLPFTFSMEPVPAFALLLGMYAVTSTSDTIASVLLGIPGTAASQATILDGYPLAQKGQAARAFGAAFTVSAFGGVFGALILAVSLPLILPVILAFSSPEFFMLGVLGLAMVGSVSGGSVLKGLTIAALNKGFTATLKDSEYIQQAQKVSSYAHELVPHARVKALLASAKDVDPAILATLKKYANPTRKPRAKKKAK